MSSHPNYQQSSAQLQTWPWLTHLPYFINSILSINSINSIFNLCNLYKIFPTKKWTGINLTPCAHRKQFQFRRFVGLKTCDAETLSLITHPIIGNSIWCATASAVSTKIYLYSKERCQLVKTTSHLSIMLQHVPALEHLSWLKTGDQFSWPFSRSVSRDSTNVPPAQRPLPRHWRSAQYVHFALRLWLPCTPQPAVQPDSIINTTFFDLCRPSVVITLW